MIFNSWHFLIFFPVVTALFFATRGKARHLVLFLAGCWFYMAFIPSYVLILFGMILVDYFAAFLIARNKGTRRKLWLVLSLATNLGVLGYFKYVNFFADNVAALAQMIGWNYSPEILKIALPLGLSFHTFQSMSYTIEVYWDEHKPERDLLLYALYVMYYPQLVAGPIERPQHLLPQLRKNRNPTSAEAISGLQLMAWGFFKKLFVADRLAKFVNSAYASPLADNHQSLALLVATYFFAFQIYCDFSGYTDIARGCARVMGVDLAQNFNFPYGSQTVGEFWRRWHISLSSWFRDYLYVPLAMATSRFGAWRQYAVIVIVFLVSGLWHGANWTYVIWGGLHGVFIAVGTALTPARERLAGWLGLARVPRATRAFRILAVFHLVLFTWIFFRATDVREAWLIAKIIGRFDLSAKELLILIVNNDLVRVGWFAIAALFVGEYLILKNPFEKRLPRYQTLQPYYATAAAAFLLVLMLAGAPLNESAFIYFQF